MYMDVDGCAWMWMQVDVDGYGCMWMCMDWKWIGGTGNSVAEATRGHEAWGTEKSGVEEVWERVEIEFGMDGRCSTRDSGKC